MSGFICAVLLFLNRWISKSRAEQVMAAWSQLLSHSAPDQDGHRCQQGQEMGHLSSPGWIKHERQKKSRDAERNEKSSTDASSYGCSVLWDTVSSLMMELLVWKRTEICFWAVKVTSAVLNSFDTTPADFDLRFMITEKRERTEEAHERGDKERKRDRDVCRGMRGRN